MRKTYAQKLALAAALAVIPGNLAALLLGLASDTETYALLFIGLSVYLYASGWAVRSLVWWRRAPETDKYLWALQKLGALGLLFLNLDFMAMLIFKPASSDLNPANWLLPFINFFSAWILAAYYLVRYFKKT